MPDVDTAKKVTVQFRYRRYRQVLSGEDANAAPDTRGYRPREVVKARNWKVEFDLSDPEQARKLEELKRLPQYGVDFWTLDKADRRKDSIEDRAKTLDRLFKMKQEQLIEMMTPDEWARSGLIPGRASITELIMAIIDSKKLNFSPQETEE